MKVSTHETPNSVACHAASARASALGSRSSPELESQLDALHLKLGGPASPPVPTPGSTVVDRVGACSHLLSQIDAAAAQLRQRVEHAESLHLEMDLQLQARTNESQTDGLTGIANRRVFDQEFSERCTAAQNSGCPLVLVILDIDHFKAVNDTRGHHVGDAVLHGLAKLFRDCLPPGALFARYGGEEFAIVLSGMYLDNAIEVIEQLRAQVSRTQFRCNGQVLGVTISCGLGQLGSQDHSEQLSRRADVALYAAKQAGRNRTFWHDGHELHLATVPQPRKLQDAEAEPDNSPEAIVELGSPEEWATAKPSQGDGQSASVLNLRTMRANWCDGTMLFWSIRQRIAEWQRGGDSLCVLAIDVDNRQQITRSYGPVALHFMMRAQMLHLDGTLRDMDIVARTCYSRIIVVLPRTTLPGLVPILRRLHESMDRFAFPTMREVLEYSVSIGVAEVSRQDDASQLVQRAEAALLAAQSAGIGKFFAHDGQRIRKLDVE